MPIGVPQEKITENRVGRAPGSVREVTDMPGAAARDPGFGCRSAAEVLA